MSRPRVKHRALRLATSAMRSHARRRARGRARVDVASARWRPREAAGGVFLESSLDGFARRPTTRRLVRFFDTVGALVDALDGAWASADARAARCGAARVAAVCARVDGDRRRAVCHARHGSTVQRDGRGGAENVRVVVRALHRGGRER